MSVEVWLLVLNRAPFFKVFFFGRIFETPRLLRNHRLVHFSFFFLLMAECFLFLLALFWQMNFTVTDILGISDAFFGFAVRTVD